MALNPKIREEFIKSFETDCFELIIDAYSTSIAEKSVQLNWLENDFSELLGYYINNSSLSVEKGIFCKTENKLFHNNAKLEKGYADKLSRVDFVYASIWKEQKFEYFMEAKRLKEKDSHLKREYIKEGMDRFVSKKYPHGCMIGYLLEGNPKETINGINSLLKKDKRRTETLNFKSNLLFKFYYESNHSAIGILKHLIFDFTSILN